MSADYILTVRVTDVNDVSPACTSTLYHASIAEDVTVGTSVLQLSCSDKDNTTANNQIADYTIISQTPRIGKTNWVMFLKNNISIVPNYVRS